MLTLENLFDENTKMEDDKKKIIAKILIDTSDKLVDHLSKNDYNTSELDKTTGQIYLFIKTNGEFLQTEEEKILRFLRDVNESIENLIAIHSHRTPISLKAYCKIHIHVSFYIHTNYN